MADPFPTFVSVLYVDPWGPAPPKAFQAGLIVNAKGTPPDSTYVIAAQLLQGATQFGVAVGASPTLVRILPPAPLAATVAYTVQTQWVKQGTSPSTIDWSDPTKLASGPVVVAQMRVVAAGYAPSGLVATWASAAPNSGPTGGYAQVFDSNGNEAWSVSGSGVSGTKPFAPKKGETYVIGVSGLQPITPQTQGGFSAPFSIGPMSPLVPLPGTGPDITAVVYDGTAVAVTWTPLPAPKPPAAVAPAYSLHVLAGGQDVASFPAGASGGRAVVAVPAGAQLTVAGAASYGPLAGPLGATQPVLAATTRVGAVTVAPGTGGNTKVGVTLEPLPSAPAGVAATVDLLVAGAVASSAAATGTPPVANFDTALPSGAAIEVRARLGATSGTATLSGPPGPAQPVLATVPTVASATYDGARLGVEWTRVPHALGYTVTLTSGKSTTLVFTAGEETGIDIDVFLDLSTTWQVGVQAFAGGSASQASAATAVTLPAIAPPSIRRLAYDGARLTVDWQRASLPFMTGYTVTLAGGTSTSVDVGTGTSATIPLTTAAAAGTTVTVTARSATRSTAASAAVAVVSAVPAIDSVAVQGQAATVGWTVGTPPASPSYAAELLDGDSVIAGATATATGATLQVPSHSSGALAARGHVESGVARGPDSAPVPVLAVAPALEFSALVDGVLSLRWAPLPQADVNGYAVTYGKTGDAAVTVATDATAVDIPVASSALAPGTVKLAALAPHSAGPAATQAIVSSYALTAGSYDGATLSLTATGTPDPVPQLVWADVLVEGRVVARSAVAGATSVTAQVPVALPAGAAATVRVTGVGTGSLTPPSASLALPTSAPAGVEAVYDGAQLHVSWGPVPDPGIGGYLVSVAGATTTPPPKFVPGAGVGAVSLAATFTLPFGSTAKVTVQAATALSSSAWLTGPCAAAAVAPVLAGYARAVAVGAAGQPPYLYRRGQYAALSDVSGKNVVAYLPNPFTGAGNQPVPAGSGQLFQVSPAPGGSALSHQLTIDKSIWTTLGAAAVRTDVRTTYRAFLVAIEQAGAKPWAIRMLRQMIAAAMPQTFAETLYYRYGVWRDAQIRAVDLEPGLRLQISGALYQLIVSGAPDPRNGFMAAGGETYDLAEAIPSGFAAPTPDGPPRALTVDAFLSLLMPGASGSSAGVAAGPVDFFQKSNRQSYYRLFYPSEFVPSGGGGSAQAIDNVLIVGAPTWQVLEATTDYIAAHAALPTTGGFFSAYFRGRAALTPLLAAAIAGEERWVPAGTTVRQLLTTAGLGVWPDGGGGSVSLQRPAATVFDQPFGGATLRFEPVDLSDAAVASLTPALWPLDLPVLGGDSVAVAGAGS